ncbi:MAG TPA: hypothetical protein VMS86_11325 [Thermoanaerobaculia bacterium]|nr:hypothetical protein [Thermoanaerobaculia bacterium]
MGEAAGVALEPEHGPPRDSDVRHSQADPEGAAEALAFQTRVDLAEGLRWTARA